MGTSVVCRKISLTSGMTMQTSQQTSSSTSKPGEKEIITCQLLEKMRILISKEMMVNTSWVDYSPYVSFSTTRMMRLCSLKWIVFHTTKISFRLSWHESIFHRKLDL